MNNNPNNNSKDIEVLDVNSNPNPDLKNTSPANNQNANANAQPVQPTVAQPVQPITAQPVQQNTNTGKPNSNPQPDKQNNNDYKVEKPLKEVTIEDTKSNKKYIWLIILLIFLGIGVIFMPEISEFLAEVDYKRRNPMTISIK